MCRGPNSQGTLTDGHFNEQLASSGRLGIDVSCSNGCKYHTASISFSNADAYADLSTDVYGTAHSSTKLWSAFVRPRSAVFLRSQLNDFRQSPSVNSTQSLNRCCTVDWRRETTQCSPARERERVGTVLFCQHCRNPWPVQWWHWQRTWLSRRRKGWTKKHWRLHAGLGATEQSKMRHD